MDLPGPRKSVMRSPDADARQNARTDEYEPEGIRPLQSASQVWRRSLGVSGRNGERRSVNPARPGHTLCIVSGSGTPIAVRPRWLPDQLRTTRPSALKPTVMLRLSAVSSTAPGYQPTCHESWRYDANRAQSCRPIGVHALSPSAIGHASVRSGRPGLIDVLA